MLLWAYGTDVLPVFAGKTQKAWTFTLNDDGECVVERSFDTDNGKAKKEAEEVMENISDSLNMCEEEMNKIFNAFAKALK